MKHLLERRAGNELVHIIATALMIEVDWTGIMLFPGWGHYASWKEPYRIGVFAAIVVGVFASTAYVRWVILFQGTDHNSRKEKFYLRTRDAAWLGMLAFMASQLFL